MRRLHVFSASLMLTLGCAAPAVQHSAEPLPGAPEPQLVRVADPSGSGLVSLVLEPTGIAAVAGPSSLGPVAFQVGAIYARKGEGLESRHNLGFIIEARSPSGLPVFKGDHRLLLEMDGRVFMSPPPSPRLYSVRGQGADLTEVIMVPVSRNLMRRFVDAEVVRGRLGRWATLEFSKEERARFVKLLGEVPEDATFGGGPRKTPELPRTVIGSY